MKKLDTLDDFLIKEKDPFKFYLLLGVDDINEFVGGDMRDFDKRLYHYFLKKYVDVIIYDDTDKQDFSEYDFSTNSIAYSNSVLHTNKNDKKTPVDDKIKKLNRQFKPRTEPIFLYNSNNTTSKIESYKGLDYMHEYFPKTVFDEKDLGEITFPMIAKPDMGHSGQGIKKFETLEEYETFMSKKSNKKYKFDLYSDCVDFKREFRAVFFRDKIVTISERILGKDGKSIFNKKIDEPTGFKYIEQDIERFPYLDSVMHMGKEANKFLDLNTFSMDFFLTTDNTLKIIEFNSGTGLGAYKFMKLYKTILDYFGFEIDFFVQRDIDSLCKTYLWNYAKKNKPEI